MLEDQKAADSFEVLVRGLDLADLALDGKTELPYQFVCLDRLTGS